MKSGEIYRGLLLSAEDTMNMSLSEVLRTARDGRITKLPSVYLRGSSIRFVALPDLLKNAPSSRKSQQWSEKWNKPNSSGKKIKNRVSLGQYCTCTPWESSPDIGSLSHAWLRMILCWQAGNENEETNNPGWCHDLLGFGGFATVS